MKYPESVLFLFVVTLMILIQKLLRLLHCYGNKRMKNGVKSNDPAKLNYDKEFYAIFSK